MKLANKSVSALIMEFRVFCSRFLYRKKVISSINIPNILVRNARILEVIENLLADKLKLITEINYRLKSI